MTLVVTEISSLGIIQVSDRRVYVRGTRQFRDNAVKSHYASLPDIALGAWGVAAAGNFDLQAFLSDYAANLPKMSDVFEVARDLRDRLDSRWRSVADLANIGPRGVHIAGYRDGWPFLAHVHCGHEDDRLAGMQLQVHFPNPANTLEQERYGLAARKAVRLQNGIYEQFNALAGSLDLHTDRFPSLSLPDSGISVVARTDLYREMFRVIAMGDRAISPT